MTVKNSISSLLSLGLCFSLALSGCSSTGAGSKDGANDESGLSESDLNAQREGRFGSGSIPTPEGEGVFRDVHFDYDSSSIDDSARQDLEYNVKILQENADIHVTLEGHCDARGTSEYNMALGAERARSVKSALQGLGISASRLETVSYGEEVPLDPAQDEGAYAKNRRVHFSASRDIAQ